MGRRLWMLARAPRLPSQTRAVPSQEAKAKRLPSAEMASELTTWVCRSKVFSRAPVFGSEICTTSFQELEASFFPSSGENTTELIPATCRLESSLRRTPVVGFHSRTLWSQE